MDLSHSNAIGPKPAKMAKTSSSSALADSSCPDTNLSSDLGFLDACMWNVVVKHPGRNLPQDNLVLLAMAVSKDNMDRVRYCAVGEALPEGRFRILSGSSLMSMNALKTKKALQTTAKNRRVVHGTEDVFRPSPNGEWSGYVLLDKDLIVDSAEEAAKIVLGKFLKWERFDIATYASLDNMYALFHQGARPPKRVFKMSFADAAQPFVPSDKNANDDMSDDAVDDAVMPMMHDMLTSDTHMMSEPSSSMASSIFSSPPPTNSRSFSSKVRTSTDEPKEKEVPHGRFIQVPLMGARAAETIRKAHKLPPICPGGNIAVSISFINRDDEVVREEYLRVLVDSIATLAADLPHMIEGLRVSTVRPLKFVGLLRTDRATGDYKQVEGITPGKLEAVQTVLPEIIRHTQAEGLCLEIRA
jgi:hypothetical protein